MKFLLVVYVVIWGLVFLWAMSRSDDVDENGYFKFQWRFVIWFILVLGTPIIAKVVL